MFLSCGPAYVIVPTLVQPLRVGRLLPSPVLGARVKPQSSDPAGRAPALCPPTVPHKVILPAGFPTLLLLWLVWEGGSPGARMQVYNYYGFIGGLRSRWQRIGICLEDGTRLGEWRRRFIAAAVITWNGSVSLSPCFLTLLKKGARESALEKWWEHFPLSTWDKSAQVFA